MSPVFSAFYRACAIAFGIDLTVKRGRKNGFVFTGFSSGTCVLDVMRESTAQLERNVGIAGDPRWELVERIVASPCFVKSPRLCSFLIYICDLCLRGRHDELNELNIGGALFDRPANYDPSADGIVRSHASRLRQRLEQYFSEEGAQEPIRLLIPKGGYML